MKTQMYVRPTTEMIRVQTAAQVLLGASDQGAHIGADPDNPELPGGAVID